MHLCGTVLFLLVPVVSLMPENISLFVIDDPLHALNPPALWTDALQEGGRFGTSLLQDDLADGPAVAASEWHVDSERVITVGTGRGPIL